MLSKQSEDINYVNNSFNVNNIISQIWQYNKGYLINYII